MEEAVYYTVLNRWSLTKYINIQTSNIEDIVADTERFLAEIKLWHDENIHCLVQEETTWEPHTLIFYTYNKKIAEKAFKREYRISEKQAFLGQYVDDSTNGLGDVASKEQVVTDSKEILTDSLSNALTQLDQSVVRPENLSTDEEELPEDLFDDLKDIGVQTVDGQAAPTQTTEELPDELFDDLEDEEEADK